jgi:hypothetical protein
MRVLLHDGRLVVRDGGDTMYAERRALAESDSGVVITLPEGMESLDYDADNGIVRHFDAHGNCYPLEGRVQHAEGDAIIAALAGMIAAKVARDTPPPPPPDPLPTAEQIARAERRAALASEAEVDALIEALRSATPAQIVNWVQNNVTDLPSARAVLARLAVAVAYALSGGRDR